MIGLRNYQDFKRKMSVPPPVPVEKPKEESEPQLEPVQNLEETEGNRIRWPIFQDKGVLIISDREAAGRCPKCSHFYCRECITEHDDKVICASCLEKQFAEVEDKKGKIADILKWVGVVFGFFFCWLFFYFLGKILLMIPSAFHEGTIWQ